MNDTTRVHPAPSGPRPHVPRVRVGDLVRFHTTAGVYRPTGEWKDNTWRSREGDEQWFEDTPEPFAVLALVTHVHPGAFYLNLRVFPESQFVGVEFGVPHSPGGEAFTWDALEARR